MKADNTKISSRLLFFAFSSVSLFFFFFAYDSPSPMYSGLQDIFGSNYSSYHNLLFSVYALPNLLLPLLFSLSGGSESRKMVYTYFLIVLGQTVTSLGVFMEMFEFILAGRFIIGLGGESFTIFQNKILASLFLPHEHGRVFGLSLAIGRIGSILAQLLLGSLIEKGALVCSVIATCLVWIGGALVFLAYRQCELIGNQNNELEIEENNVHYLLPYFIIMTILLACSSSPFSSNNSAILQRRLLVDFKTTSKILALQELMALLFTVMISIMTDRYGHRLSCICLGSLSVTLGHMLIFYSTQLVYLPSILLGISSGFQACAWPCYPLILSPNKLGIGLSLLSCFINLVYSIWPPIISKITDINFKVSEYYSVVFAGLATAISAYIVFANSHRDFGLNGRRHYHKI